METNKPYVSMGSAPHTNPGFGGVASSFTHWRVPFGRRVLLYDTRPDAGAGGNDNHLQERRAYWQGSMSIAEIRTNV